MPGLIVWARASPPVRAERELGNHEAETTTQPVFLSAEPSARPEGGPSAIRNIPSASLLGSCSQDSRHRSHSLSISRWQVAATSCGRCDARTCSPDLHTVSRRSRRNRPSHSILQKLKSFTAHAINKSLKRSGPVWQDES